MKKILVIGATSAIAEQCARIWAQRGDALYLAGRNAQRLDSMVQDLKIRGAARVDQHTLDLRNLNEHPHLLAQAETAMGGLDMVLIAHGTLSDQGACEKSVELTLGEINTNALSVVSLMTLAAQRLEPKGEGTLAVISSVAGDRGRASNYVYGSAKALVTAFASGLRQRLRTSNVAVVTIKPGFVDTPMTAQFKKGPLWAQATPVAQRIVHAMDMGKDEVYVPGFWRWVMWVIRHIPEGVFKRMRL